MAAFLGGVYVTDSGMLCLWDPAGFAAVADYDAWEQELCEDKDIVRHIKAGHLVPVNTDRGIDGAFAVILRVGEVDRPATLTEREAGYILAESEPYLLVSTGRICLSGLEQVEGHPGREVGCLPAAEGQYAAKVYFIAWDDEPGMKDRRGRPKPGALPDFVLLVNPKPKGRTRFRTKVHALESPK
jgi:hypothetical protein